MTLRPTTRFASEYAKLTGLLQRRVDKVPELLLSNPRHPSLHDGGGAGPPLPSVAALRPERPVEARRAGDAPAMEARFIREAPAALAAGGFAGLLDWVPDQRERGGIAFPCEPSMKYEPGEVEA